MRVRDDDEIEPDLNQPRLDRRHPQRTPKWKLILATWPSADKESHAERVALKMADGMSEADAGKQAYNEILAERIR